MITSVYSASPFLTVNGGSSNGVYINQYTNNNNPIHGMIRMNGSNFEVFDGSSWKMLGGGIAEVALTGNAVTALQWAEKKMMDEARLHLLAKQHPAIAEAVDKLEKVMDEIKVLVALTEET